jgi:glucose-6-phosphate isomerase
MIKVNLESSTLSKDFLMDKELAGKIAEAYAKLHDADIARDNLWVTLPADMLSSDELPRIKTTAEWIRKNSDVLLVIGVGGSYAGALAGLQALGSDLPIEFLGTSFDPTPIASFLKKYSDKRVSVNVISKSGTTLEVTAAFNVINDFMRKKYDDAEYKQRVVITTSGSKGYMYDFAMKNDLSRFLVPDGVGGRYSVLSAVGLLPLAVGGIDVDKMLQGAQDAQKYLATNNLAKNPACQYAAARYILNTDGGKGVEILASFYEGLSGLGQWWQQLFGESDGKDGRGLLPVPLVFSRDLHSMGQYIQQGTQQFIETMLDFENPMSDVQFADGEEPAIKTPTKTINAINRAAFDGTRAAHADAGVPVIVLTADRLDAYGFGELVYFFQTACAITGYLLGVNPFDQPGVEFYKKAMREQLNSKK